MKTKQLLEALGQLDEQYILEAVSETHREQKKGWTRWAAVAAIVILTVVGATGTAMAASEQFRQMVLSFFHIEQTEYVPDPNSKDFVFTQSDIGGMVKAEYIPLEEEDYQVGFGTLYQVDNEENGTIRSVRFWAVEDGSIFKVDTQKNSFHVIWQDTIYEGDIYWCVYNGEVSLYEGGTSEADSGWYASSIPGRTDAILLYLSQGAYGEYRQYPMLYHLETGETEDILQKTGIKELSWPKDYQWSNDLSKVLVTCHTLENEEVRYYCDVVAKTLYNIESFTGVECSNAFFADDNTLILLQMIEGDGSIWAYNLTTGEITQTFNEVKFLENHEIKPSSREGIMLFGGRIGLYVEQKGNLSVLDLKTGSEQLVNGFTFDEGGTFLSNRANTKLLYNVTDDKTDGSLDISQLGVLDLEAGVFKAFDREGYDRLHEWSVGWFDEYRIGIRSGEPGSNAFYLYEF